MSLSIFLIWKNFILDNQELFTINFLVSKKSYFYILVFLNTYQGVSKSDYKISRIFYMTQNSMNTPYAKRVAEKFREAQNYLKTNGFSRSTKQLLEDIENSVEK